MLHELNHALEIYPVTGDCGVALRLGENHMVALSTKQTSSHTGG